MKTQAELVIIGAGIVGCSAAYHLTKMGWRDIIVLDKGNLPENDGSTSHAPGGVVVLSHNKLLTQMAAYSSALYAALPPFSAERNSYNAVGSLEMARTPERWANLVQLHGEGKSYGVESHLLSPQECQDRIPYLDPTQFVGCLNIPSSALISGGQICGSFMRATEATGGAKFVANTGITAIDVRDGNVRAALTDNPDLPRIDCAQILLCANIWAPAISEKLGITLPLLAAEHQYAISTPLAEMAHFDRATRDDEVIYPTIRDLDNALYFRQHWNAYGVGSYHHKPLMVHPRDVKQTAMHDFTPADFTPAWNYAQQLFPMLRGSDLTTKFNGMFAFSVDGMPIMGEAATKGLWVATASWITHAGGVAKSIAEWMTHGEAEWDMRQTNIDRFHGFQKSQTYIDIVCAKNYREVYDLVHPKQPITEPRNIRLSPFHARLEAFTPDYASFAGLELPNWFEENSRLLEKYDDRIPHRSGWAAQYWSRIQGAEHLATRENVALFDLTGLSIIEVAGKGAVDFVNYLCSNEMNKAVGQVVYTTWLTPKGGVKRDLAVTRLATDRFWMFVGEGTLPQDLAWVRQHAATRGDSSVIISNISNSYTALGLWGPNARKVLEKVTRNDVSNEAFPYFSAQWIEIGPIPVLALRISYAGELGWELHIPMDSALPVWDVLWAAGRAVDMVAAGMGAFDSLRLEKGYRLWGGDVYTEYNPYEAGLGWAVRLKKGDFVGRDACVKLKQQPLKKTLCCLTLDDPNGVLMGYEPIFDNGQCLGHVTSANYGYSIAKFIAYGYLPADYANAGAQVEIEYFGTRLGATVCAEPLYDPQMARMKA